LCLPIAGLCAAVINATEADGLLNGNKTDVAFYQDIHDVDDLAKASTQSGQFAHNQSIART
jgi:hypothetical protein